MCLLYINAPQFVHWVSTAETALTNVVNIAETRLRQAERDVSVTQRASLGVKTDGLMRIVIQVHYCIISLSLYAVTVITYCMPHKSLKLHCVP